MRNFFLTATATILTAVSFSVPAWAGEDQFFGTGIGAAMGGLVGSQFGRGTGRLAATGTGVVVGGLIGNDIGRSMDRSEYTYVPSGSSGTPESVYYGTYSYRPNYVAPPAPPPVTVYNTSSASYCRTYSQQILIGNQVQESYGTACLQPDGSWRIVQ